MVSLTPQKLTHQGTILAEAFLLSANILSEPEMRRRVVEHWQAGEEVFRHGNNLIAILREAVRVNSVNGFGLPFVRYGKLLSAFPIEKKDQKFLPDVMNGLIFMSAGNLEIIYHEDLKSEAIESWFDTSDLFVTETESLGRSEPVQPKVLQTVSDKDLDLRSDLKTVPQPDPQLADILEKLREMKSGLSVKGGSSMFQSSTAPDRGAVGNVLASFFDNLKRLFAFEAASSNSSSTSKGNNDAPHFEQFTPGPFSRIYDHLHRLTVRAVIQMKMGRVFGRRQAKYLAEMMEKFERGDLAEALKYAIPLEDMQALREVMEKPTSLFVPRPRSNLQISIRQNASRSSINLESDWFEHLRKLYRQSFEQLESRGRLEEAAFVLAELLKSNAEAVEFLSKHGKYRLAAELAEARDLPKETVVRQWFLAGDKKRAVQLAIFYNCFEYAVTRLEQESSANGAELREIWAESLAESGNYPAAVDVIWKLEAKRVKAVDWIEKTIEFGGTAGARMLAKKALLYPAKFDEIKEKFQIIINGREPEAIERRNSFARALLKQETNDELRVLLRPLLRKILSDRQNTSQSLEPKEFRELVGISKDRALRADLPAFPHPVRVTGASEPFEIDITSQDQGSVCINDACVLPDGKIAVALGESGVKILSRRGKTVAFFDQPTQQMIVSDSSTKAIAVSTRGETLRLARIDFVERRSEFWCDAKLDVFAPSFDGNTWFAGFRDEFYAIDANAQGFEAVWGVGDVGGAVYSTVRSATHAEFLTSSSDGGFETWWYELPNLTLRNRNQASWHDAGGVPSMVYAANISAGTSAVAIIQEQIDLSDQPRFYASFFDNERNAGSFEFPVETVRLDRPDIFNQHSVIVGYSEQQAKVFMFSGPGNLSATFSLGSAQKVSTKLDENGLAIGDNCGRLLVYDYKNRNLRHNLRL